MRAGRVGRVRGAYARGAAHTALRGMHGSAGTAPRGAGPHRAGRGPAYGDNGVRPSAPSSTRNRSYDAWQVECRS